MGGHGWVSRVEMGEGRARRPWGLVVLRECRGARTVHMRDGSVRLLDRREADEAEACHKGWEGGGGRRVWCRGGADTAAVQAVLRRVGCGQAQWAELRAGTQIAILMWCLVRRLVAASV